MSQPLPQPLPSGGTWVTRHVLLWSGAAALVAMVVYGSVYWTAPYNDLDIGSLTLVVYLLAALPVVALRATNRAPFLVSAAVLPVALVAAVMLRVTVDVALDPTSHNLWPLELVIGGFVGTFWGLLAAGLGEVVLRLRH